MAIGGDATAAAIAMNAADRAYEEAHADAAQVYDDAMATASHQANDAWEQAVHTYIVNALPLELTAFTDSTNALVDATKDMTTDLTQALRDTASAERTQHLAELDAALTAANGKAALDDPIAIAAAQNDKAQSVLAATQELADLQAEPIDAFVDAGPDGGGWLSGIGDFFADVWDDVTDWWDNSTFIAGVGGFFEGAINYADYWADIFSDPTTTIGQLITGDIYGNEIWGDPGFGLNFTFGITMPGNLGGINGGGGLEIIFIPETGDFAFYWYDGAGPTVTNPGVSWNVGVDAQSTYNLSTPEGYTRSFYNGSANGNLPSGWGGQAGISVADNGFDGPTTYYGGVTYGSPQMGLSGQIQNYGLIGELSVPWYTPQDSWNPFQLFDSF